ncbi:unnamed protein product [Blepharisma stoltei]|uniref:Ycf2 n=1 Tax=Blepharisma stoltei TaxID=1481888 RepID=A0AAU9JZ18_9CILI|nr:unnamed protein product [Blepharisma stoltei]
MDKINIDFLNFETRFSQEAQNSRIEEEFFIEETKYDHIAEFPLKSALNLDLDESLNGSWNQKFLDCDTAPNHSRRKRGRKPIRPNDPIKKKTEEKDKFWLRSFRSYISNNYHHFKTKLTAEDNSFWASYVSSKGKPDKGNKFLSYGRKYKNYLFSHPSFVKYFQEWFKNFGAQELSRKCQPGSDLWFVFYDYGSNDLYNYFPHDSTVKESSSTYHISFSQDEFPSNCTDNEAFIESLFNQM